MKITDIRWTRTLIPIEGPLRNALDSHSGVSGIIIENNTDEGITGPGRGVPPGGHELARYSELAHTRQMGGWTDNPRQLNRIMTRSK